MDEHIPVLVEEVLEVLAPSAGDFFVDGTFGRGGHTARLLEAIGPSGSVLALDRDPAAIEAGRRRFAAEPRLELLHAEFSALATTVAAHARGRAVRGVLLDLGVSSPQLDEAERGFSFSQDGPLDMRMDPSRSESAAGWLARATEREIADVIYELGEERFARRIAAAIVAARSETPITRTAALAAIVQRAVRTRDGKHPATRSFQAIRMHVNDEVGQLRTALEAAFAVLAVGGRLAVISFHSLEDRIVKQFIRVKSSVDPVFAGLPVIPLQAQPVMREVGRKRRAGEAELARNLRARSAVLRCAEKLAAAPVAVRSLL
ncbi:MAG: 16S rRNA (cytosine(1402)-N(4))-methyltransferase RsmH [Gammaproteobacteria bacterium]|nr:16S rRNA (cytosine(1402)-N(4))-methyltransferase RsmH [Gammaproteobacteria bacterium]